MGRPLSVLRHLAGRLGGSASRDTIRVFKGGPPAFSHNDVALRLEAPARHYWIPERLPKTPNCSPPQRLSLKKLSAHLGRPAGGSRRI